MFIKFTRGVMPQRRFLVNTANVSEIACSTMRCKDPGMAEILFYCVASLASATDEMPVALATELFNVILTDIEKRKIICDLDLAIAQIEKRANAPPAKVPCKKCGAPDSVGGYCVACLPL